MNSYTIEGWCRVKSTDTIVPVIRAVVSDFLEHCFEEEKNWDHIWEYLQIILPELGFGNYLVEPFIKDIFDCRTTNNYEVGQKDRDQVDKLRKLKLPEQRSPEWFTFRQGRLTASELSYCVSQPHHSAVSQKIILQKIHPKSVPYISSAATSHGTLYEPIAQMLYEKECRTRLYEFGCIPHETVSWLAASPDGITEDGVMVEIKCPYSRTPKGVPSMNYYTQIQAQLEVCQFELCDFMECEIEMYESRKAYIEDTAPKNETTDNLRKHHHLYKGMRREYIPKQNSGIIKGVSISIARNGPGVNECMNLDSMTKRSSRDWIASHLDQHRDSIGYLVRYWVVRRIWITRIPKNTKWFNSILPKARSFWEEVCRKKEEGMKPPPVPSSRQSMIFIEETIE